ncbi:MAG TPA: NAD(P)-dependent oxidoreductase [Verrucomicrobiae bacterium]|nr:NAD(P)-dependent oxidoreductase [Verrucomicrobiae bacterium]
MRIAVFGLGLIGSSWARHWREDGHDLRAWNRTPKPQVAGYTSDAKAAVRGAQLVAIVVADPLAVHSVLSQIEDLIDRTVTVVQHSTIGTADTLAFSRRVTERGGTYIDMPFTGSRIAAEKRDVVFFVGQDGEDDLDAVADVYRPISRDMIRVGGVGAATSLKLAMNLIVANTYQALAEGLTLAEQAGISRELFFRALDQNVGKSGVSELKKAKIFNADFSPHFAVKHMHKDLRLALRLAMDLGIVLPQTECLEETYSVAQEMGLGDEDFAALLKTLEPGAGE